MNRDLKGDDFVPSEEYQEQTNPSYAKKHENSFSHMKETDPKNEQIVFGTAGQGTSSIRQRFKVPVSCCCWFLCCVHSTSSQVEDNWNLVTDSSVDYDKVRDLSLCLCLLSSFEGEGRARKSQRWKSFAILRFLIAIP